ncbi:carbonic anhydrase [Oryzomicrobium terrae]|uniref:Carbonic anhydrase n=1 Tax=Oryzomicrobium terrae TaxID=1735038 RepID=A0A5C1E3M6_9RHOO|nr:carbonic anhydrase [Oryzomicrobium terrae]
MPHLDHLFENNRSWAEKIRAEDPEFFDRLAKIQAPEYLWIGCSDSRVPANQITGLDPGEVFVHRNVGNVVVHSDLNCLSVLQYAVDVLRVKHVLVVGHYGCGGVKAALHGLRVGLVDNWLRHIQDVRQKHAAMIDGIADPDLRHDRLCELNVIEQVFNVSHTTIVRDAWDRGQDLTVHGWVYSLENGLAHDMAISVAHHDEVHGAYATALARLTTAPSVTGE